MGKRLIIILAFVTLLAYGWPAWTDFTDFPLRSAPLSFSVHPDTPAIADPFITSEYVNPVNTDSTVHVGSICEMADGRLAAAWYGGTREGAKDVAIYFSIKSSGSDAAWSPPRAIVDRISSARELKRYIRKVGNPVLFSGPDQQLRLIYVTITVGGWSGSSLNIKCSADGGDTWADSQRLTLSPFFNISELVKGRPLPLKTVAANMNQDCFAVPIYHECLGYFPEILWMSFSRKDNHIIYEKSRMAGGTSFIQPSVAPFNAFSAAAFYRCLSTAREIAMATTENGGKSWSQPAFTGLPNPDSAVDAVPLGDGRILLAFNDSRSNREVLKLAVSENKGKNWIRIHTLEESVNDEFSYPYMIRGQKGMIHLVYTWKRKRIKHLSFNEAWVRQRLKKELDK